MEGVGRELVVRKTKLCYVEKRSQMEAVIKFQIRV